MTPTGKKEIKEAVLIAVLVAVGQAVVTGIAEEVKHLIKLRKERAAAKKAAQDGGDRDE